MKVLSHCDLNISFYGVENVSSNLSQNPNNLMLFFICFLLFIIRLLEIIEQYLLNKILLSVLVLFLFLAVVAVIVW